MKRSLITYLYKKVKTKVFIFSTLVFVITSSLISFTIYSTTKSSMIDLLDQNSTRNIEVLDEMLSYIFEKKHQEITTIAEQLGSTNIRNKAKVYDILKSYKIKEKDIISISLTSSEGDLLGYASHSPYSAYDPKSKAWFTKAQSSDDVVISDPHVDGLNSTLPVVTIAKSTYDRKAVVAINLSLAILQERMNSITIGHDGYPILLNENHKLVIHPTLQPGMSLNKVPYLLKVYESDSGNFLYQTPTQTRKILYTTNDYTGWKVAGTASTSEIMAETKPLILWGVVPWLFLIAVIGIRRIYPVFKVR